MKFDSLVLVTGASGFIGGAVAAALVEKGYRVRALYRRPQPPESLVRLANTGAEIVRVDLEAFETLEPVLSRCVAVIHAAAKVLDYGKRIGFVRANVEVTRALLGEAKRAECRRFLFVSSMSVHGFGTHVDSNESGPYYPLRSHYQRTKMAAENLVRAANSPDFETIVLRPGLVYGPGDTTTLAPFFELLLDQSLPKLSGFKHMNCPIYIADLVEAVALAIESADSGGEVFDLASGEKASLLDAIEYSAKILDVPPPSLPIPQWAARLGAFIAEFASQITGYRFRPPLTRYLARQLSADFHFSPERARTNLGFSPRVDWRDGIRKAIDMFLTSRSDG